MVQFQATVFDRDDVLKLMQSINGSLADESLDDVRLAKAFNTWWPELEGQLNGIAETPSQPEENAQLDPARINSVLEELIDLTRSNHKLLREPGAMMSPGMWEEVLMTRGFELFMPEIEDLTGMVIHYRQSLKMHPAELGYPVDERERTIEMLNRIESALTHMRKRFRSRLRHL